MVSVHECRRLRVYARQMRATIPALRTLLALAAAGSAIVVLARAMFGHFHLLLVPVHSPLPAESLFAVCLLALVLTGMRGRRGEVVSSRSFRWQPLLIALAGIALAFWGIQRVSFLSDDYFVVL